MTRIALILGATGRFGRHAATGFEAAGWTVRRFDRSKDDLNACAANADVIVNAWNPPYDKWASQVPQLHARVRKAARASGATVILPGNVYVFGQNGQSVWDETSPHLATNPLGRIRIELEQAFHRDGVKTIVLRAGDFLDTQRSGNWFDKVMTPKIGTGILVYPGATDRRHAWAFLPDLARAAVALAERRDSLPDFADIPFPGFTLTGEDLAQALGRVTGGTVRIKQMSWMPIQLARPFWPLAKHLLEMRYLWSQAHQLDGAALSDLLPGLEMTATDAALAAALPDQLVTRSTQTTR